MGPCQPRRRAKKGVKRVRKAKRKSRRWRFGIGVEVGLTRAKKQGGGGGERGQVKIGEQGDNGRSCRKSCPTLVYWHTAITEDPGEVVSVVVRGGVQPPIATLLCSIRLDSDTSGLGDSTKRVIKPNPTSAKESVCRSE